MRDIRTFGMVLLPALVLAAEAPGKRAAPPSPLTRLSFAEAVVVGKVIGFGNKLVPAELTKGDTRSMQLATIEVSETLVGKTGKQIRVAYIPRTDGPGPRSNYMRVQLTRGEEVCLFLTRHPVHDRWVLGNTYDTITKTNPQQSTLIAEVRRAARLLANPMAGLKSTDAKERAHTALLLIMRYRTPRGGATKTEPVSAEESKLILTALAEADWSDQSLRELQPQGVFYNLRLTAKDGWTPPTDFRQFPVEAKKWLRANAGKYRIQRYVLTEKPSPEPGK